MSNVLPSLLRVGRAVSNNPAPRLRLTAGPTRSPAPMEPEPLPPCLGSRTFLPLSCGGPDRMTRKAPVTRAGVHCLAIHWTNGHENLIPSLLRVGRAVSNNPAPRLRLTAGPTRSPAPMEPEPL